ncbi:uncharacterized protein METZ01_LOCUS425966, partial [marine metagenome]
MELDQKAVVNLQPPSEYILENLAVPKAIRR